MIINHNLNSMNAHRNMSFNTAQTGKSMEKLSSGLRINRAGDDAAGLAISEKMRGQIRGLDQATRNSQDGISMIQTAEGALNETHSILQRMRELGVQASNDTNVGVDRAEIQKEINQLSSEINRVGNTTEFNTQSLLKGDGQANLSVSKLVTDGNLTGGLTTNVQATQTTTLAGTPAANDTFKVALNGKEFSYTFATAPASVTAAATTLKDELQKMIDADESLKGNFTVSNAAGALTISATSTGSAAGSKGNISAATVTGGMTATGNTASVGTTTYTAATKTISFAALEQTDAATTNANLEALKGKGFTVNGTQVEFYKASEGAYTGSGIGVAIDSALAATAFGDKGDALASAVAQTLSGKIDGVTFAAATGTLTISADSTLKGEAGNAISVTDGGKQKNFEASFQVGANKGQSMTIEIADMRSEALGITGKAGVEGFTSKSVVTDGTDNQAKEAALDVSSAKAASSAVEVINKAIETVSAQRSNLGSFQNRLEHTINNLSTSAENLQAAESRIRDVDMAKEMMNFTKNNILNQAAQAMMSQANQQPQAVLQLLR